VRIIFLYPNVNAQIGFNYGLAYISAVLKQHGHHTRLINLNEKLTPVPTMDEIVREVRDYDPGLVGFSVVTNQYGLAQRVAGALKGSIDVPIICGGVHASMVPEEVMKSGLFDYACVGEGEQALLELVERLEEGGSTGDIPNIWVRRDGKVIRNNVRPFIELDKLPRTDYDLFDFQRMIDAKNGWVGMMAGRGCPYRCTYCFNHRMAERYQRETGLSGAHLNYVRWQPVEEVVSEMEDLLRRYDNISMFIFDDDIFTIDVDYVAEFCRAYRERVKRPFVCNTHVRRFDDARAGLLAEAGCRIVKFGLESGSPRIRREIMKRPMTNEQIEAAFQAAHRVGLHTTAFVMLGLPTETTGELELTIDLLARIRPGRFRWSVFFPYEGTEAYDISLQTGCLNIEKMKALTNFMDESCLNFGPEQDLFIEKLKHCLPWFVNSRIEGPAKRTYEGLVAGVLAADAASWPALRSRVLELDRETSGSLAASGIEHYAIRYNDFTAVSSQWTD